MDQLLPPLSELSADRLFEGGGETGALMRAIDWAKNPLGPVEKWPFSLKTIVRIMLTSRQPIWIGWGPDLIKLYNDPYIAIVGGKHPTALGQPASVVWREIWDVIAPRLETALHNNVGTYDESLRLMMERYGYQEETYYTFSYSPVPDDSGGVGGIICANTDDTQRIIGERQVKLLRTLAAETADARTTEDACRLSASSLAQNPFDLPFALLYLLDPEQQRVRLACQTGIEQGDPAAPEAVTLDSESLWPFREVVHAGKACIIDDLRQRAHHLPTGAWDQPPHTAVALPVARSGQAGLAGVLVVGLNPFRVLDEGYQGFLQLMAGQLAASLASARAYETERQRVEELAEIDRAKTVFFTNVSHEFRTPLTLMLGPLEDVLADPALDPGIREQLSVIQRNGLRLLKLVNTLLDFSRIESGRIEAVYVPTNLAEFTADLASVFRSLVEKGGLRLVVDCPPLPEPVYVDRDMWEKIVLNLLSNAFKFTFAGEITVSLHQVGQQVQLTVRDTGAGIPQDQVPRLFERFHRIQGARSRTHEGSGIGLALVQELVHLHGGSIRVESQLDVGTTFMITVPLGTAHLPAERIQARRTLVSSALGAAPFLEEAQRWMPAGTVAEQTTPDWLAPGASTSGPLQLDTRGERLARILLADDNADLRDYLWRLLSARYDVEAVGDGAAALRAARARPPDLVLSDVMMPELDGFGLLRELRADPRTRAIPVILLSARAGEEATIEGLASGADDYLIKPFSAREVLARVEGRLEMARLRREADTRARELETIFEAMTDGVAILDPDGRLRQMNQAAQRLLHLDLLDDPQDYFSRPLEERTALVQMRDEHGQPMPLERLPQWRVVHGEALAGADLVEALVRPPDGEERLWSFGGAPIRDDQGTIIGAVTAFRDVTERRVLERRTAESLAALLEMAHTLVQGVGLPTEETRHSPDALLRLAWLIQRVMGGQMTSAALVTRETGELQPLTIIGVSPDVENRWWQTLQGSKITDYLTPAQAERLYAGDVLTFDLGAQPPVPGQDYFGAQQVLGAAVWVNPQQLCMLGVEVRNHPTFTPAEHELVQAAVRLMALMLEREQLQRESAMARARALASEETAQRMDEFLGIASHELRTPLTSLSVSAQTAERQLRQVLETALPAGVEDRLTRTHNLVERLRQQVRRMDRLVGDLLDVTRISAGKLEMRLAPCDLRDIVQEVVEAQQAAWPTRSITLDIPADTAVPLEADADRLGQVVINYLTNALKYSEDGQPVAVRLSVEDAQARVEVRDHGPGLSADQQQQLFERFYRVPGIEQRSGSGVGLGLGLYICQTIIQRHGGQVGVQSQVGQGSTFWFTLPLA
jgi:signal transduction histidine kinase